MRRHCVVTALCIAGKSLLLLLLIVTAATAASIETKSGIRYDSVTYTVDSYFKVVKFEFGGEKRNVSFADIRAVYNDRGEDVTASVLGRYAGAQSESWQSEIADVYKEGSRKRWEFGVRLAGNLTLPVGSYYDGTTGGLGFEGDILVPVSRDLALRGTVSRSGVRNSGSIVSTEMSFHATRYLFSVQYTVPMKSSNAHGGMLYAYSGLGVVNHTGSYGGQSASFSKFLTEVGGGGISFLASGVGIDYGGSLGMVWVGSDGYAQTAILIDVKLGLIFMIPSKEQKH